jgi:hypothetical protein
MKNVIHLFAGIMVLSISFAGLNGQELQKKWYPGHYLYVSPRSFAEPMEESNRNLVKDNPYFTGYHVKYYWASLEKEKGVYDFSILEQDLATARSDGKKLCIFIHDRDHGGTTVPVPLYLGEDSIYEGGYYKDFATTANTYKYMPKLWVPAVAERMGALLKAIGARFDEDTCIAYVNLPETSLTGAKRQSGFSPIRLKDGYKIIYSAAAEAFPNTIFSQYANWPGGLERAGADEMLLHLASLRHGLGGPDALEATRPFDGSSSLGALENWFGTYYTQYRGIVPITTGAQAPSYKANNPLTVLNYAIDQLNVHFFSWVPMKKSASPDNLYGIDEVIEMLNAEMGRINTSPPASIYKNFNPDTLGLTADHIIVNVPENYATVQAALTGEWGKLPEGGNLTINVAEGVFHAPSGGNSITWPGKRLNVLILGAGAQKTIIRPNDQSLTQRISPTADGNRWMQLTGTNGMNGSSLIIKDITFQYLGSFRLVNAAGGVLNVTVDQPFEVTLENIVFDNCVGLAIVNTPRGNPIVNIENCLFKECVTTNRRDNTNFMRGLISKEGGSLAIRNTTFYSNENLDIQSPPSLNGFAVHAFTSSSNPAMNLVLENNHFVNNKNMLESYDALSSVISLKPDGAGSYYLTANNNILTGNRRTEKANDVDLYVSKQDKVLISESEGNIMTKAIQILSSGLYADYSFAGSLIGEEYTYTHPGIDFLMEGDLPRLAADLYGIDKLIRKSVYVTNNYRSNFMAYANNRILTLKGLQEGMPVEIYTITGSLVFRQKANSDIIRMEMPAGFYLVRAGDVTQRVVNL